MNPIHQILQKDKKASTALLTQAQNLSPEAVSSWLHTIDESPYPLEEWLESLLVFEAWSKHESRHLTLIHMLEYLSCCAESAKSGVKLPLSFLLTEFLRIHGVDRGPTTL
jgi:hypothetical protein